METEIDIDDQLLADAKAASGLKTDQEVVDKALRVMLDNARHRAEVMRPRGKMRLIDDPEGRRPYRSLWTALSGPTSSASVRGARPMPCGR